MRIQEKLTVYDVHGRFLEIFYSNDLGIFNLSGKNLDYANLSNLDLKNAHIRGSSLNYANLQGTSLAYTDLHGSDFKGANLTNADLTYAYADHTNFKHATLDGAIFEDARIDSSFLYGSSVIDAGFDARGYRFIAVRGYKKVARIKAGCRWYTFKEAKNHWRTSSEALHKVLYMEAEALRRKWKIYSK